MNFLFIEWLFAGTKSEFAKPFQNNEVLFQQAKTLWQKLDNCTMVPFLVFLCFGMILSVVYYYAYCNKPGRRYTPKHWIFFLVGTFVLMFLLMYSCEYQLVKPTLDGASWLEFKVALGTACYAACAYFIVSVIICNINAPTNAYRLFKF